MASFLTKRAPLPRRAFLKGMTAAGTAITVGLPPLASMFNSTGTAYASGEAIPRRFVFWFNGNGIPEQHWIPTSTGQSFELSACLSALEPVRNDVHVITGLDNVEGRGGSHASSMSGIVSGKPSVGDAPGGPSFDYLLARGLGTKGLQIGVSRDSYGGALQRNMTWAATDIPLTPEELPHRLFDRVFGRLEDGWSGRKRSVLDSIQQDVAELSKTLPPEDRHGLERHLAGIRDLERAVTAAASSCEAGLPNLPRIAKVQSDLLAYALATGQTRVASYMLTKSQGTARFPWLGYTSANHHEYTHWENADANSLILRDICAWHVEEFAYLVAKLKSIPEGDGSVLDNTCLLFVHEHAEAAIHKNDGHGLLMAGHAGGLRTGLHTHMTGTIADLYYTIANEIFDLNWTAFAGTSTRLAGLRG